MKKISFFLMAFGLVAASCTKSEFDYVYEQTPHDQFSETFVQTFGNIAPGHDWGFSSDGTTMRGASAGDGDMNNKTWEEFGGDGLSNITDQERNDVLAAIAKKVTGSKINEETIFPYENYFLQDVINFSNNSFPDAGMNNTQDASVNYLEAFSKSDNCGHVDGNNYVNVTNSKQINTYYLLRDGKQTRIWNSALMTGMTLGTDDEMRGKQFRLYINCHEEGHYSDYITVEVNGSWYICFDIACGDPAHDKDGEAGRGAAHNDWDYNDWILKITPAYVTYDMTGGKRIIAEDLAGGTSDFDYNDVVFDAVVKFENPAEYNYQNTLVAYIVLQAAGGTMPLYVAGKEVHEAFGVPTTTMVNTNAAGGAKKSPVSFKYVMRPVKDSDWSADPVELLKEIPVKVETANGTIELEVNPGAAPEKIAVPLDFEWTNEREALQSKYPKFGEYVGNPTLEWWK